MRLRLRFAGVLICFCFACNSNSNHINPGIQVKDARTPHAWLAQNDSPLLSFGGMSEFIFFANEDAFEFKRWADWQYAHGMNHVRAYLPLSWRYIEKIARDNGGALDSLLFPYIEVEPGKRKFDLTRFNDAYWKRFREQCEYLQRRGIIIHLVLWNGWQFRAKDRRGADRVARGLNWDSHFFNPKNNTNPFTRHLGPRDRYRFAFYHSVAIKRRDLAKATKSWFFKIIDTTADLDNVYYELVHDLAENAGNWERTRFWIEEMALAIRLHYKKLQPGKSIVLGMDAGGFDQGDWRQPHDIPVAGSQVDWIFTRPYFDVLIWGKPNSPEQAINWRTHYKKPYIGQPLWEADGRKYSLLYTHDRTSIRINMWQFVMAKCQQLELYTGPLPQRPVELSYPQNYSPEGVSEFENDAQVLRDVWDEIQDYPDLWFYGQVAEGPGVHQYVLSSRDEALLYLAAATGDSLAIYDSQTVQVDSLALRNGKYNAQCISPVDGLLKSDPVKVEQGSVTLMTPQFVNDLVFLIQP